MTGRATASAGVVAALLAWLLAATAAGRQDRGGETGAIRGLVTDEMGRPVPAARVALWMGGPLDGRARAATTDGDGRFELTGLPAATYTLTLSKDGQADTAFGQVLPTMPGTPIPIAPGQTREIDARLPNAGVISGVVRDQRGAPRPGSAVFAERWVLRDGRRELGQAGQPVGTNSRGEFRLHGLPPGRYVVAAVDRAEPGTRITDAERLDQALAFPIVFHPGVTDPALAGTIEVGPGQHVAGVDFQVAPSPAGSVTVDLVNPTPTPLARPRVSWRPADSGHPIRAAFGGRGVETAPGRFVMHGVPMGRHVVTARAAPRAAPGERTRPLWGFTEVVMTGSDVEVSVALQPAATIAGRYVIEGEALETPRILPRLSPVASAFAPGVSRMRTGLDRIEFIDLPPGEYRLSVPDLPASWTLLSAVADGYDLLDGTLPVRFGRDIDSLVVTLADRRTTLSGVVADAAGRRRHDAAAVIFPVDPTRRSVGSRWIRLALPDIDGRYELSGLPPGEYFVAAAAIDWDPALEPERLMALEPRARRVELRLGQPVTLDLAIAAPSTTSHGRFSGGQPAAACVQEKTC